MKVKKLFIFLLCIVLTLPLVACNKNTRPHKNGMDDDQGGKTYRVTFNVGTEAAAAGATVNPSYKDVKQNAAVGNLPVPTGYTNYTFNGWFTSDNKQLLTTTVITNNITVTAGWTSQAEQDAVAQAYENKLSTWAQPGHLYIHYKRYDHPQSEQNTVTNSGAPNYDSAIESAVYRDWGLWIWPKNDEGRLFNAMKIDESGAVYDILIDHTYNDAGWDAAAKPPTHKDIEINYADVTEVGMQLFQISTRALAGFWANDGGNNYLVLEDIKRADGSYHWFVNQGRVGSGSARFSNATYQNPYEGDDGTQHISTFNINSNADNSTEYPLAAKAAGYDDAGVGYQIFIASFADCTDTRYPKIANDGMGDLRGIIEKLDYLESLNVDVLWLTPFQSSTNYHGYDIDDYFSVDSRFGTLDDYRELVYKVHQRGMKIVMDYVLNHTSQANPWFVKSKNLVKETDADGNEIDYRNFYNWISEEKYNTLSKYEQKQWYRDEYGYYFYSSFSSDMPELNYDYQPVRDAVLEVCDYWMSFGLDGFRLDAVKHIYMNNETIGRTGGNVIVEEDKTIDPSAVQGTDEENNYDAFAYNQTRDLHFWREFNYRLKAAHPNAFLVSENFDGNPAHIEPFYAGMDSQFNFNNYYDTARSMSAAVSKGPGWAYSIYTKTTENLQKYSVVNGHYIDGMFTSNHDLPRARDRLNIDTDGTKDTYRGFFAGDKIDGTVNQVNTSMVNNTNSLLRLYYAFNMTMPGLSWIYYGDELGMSGVMQFTVDTQSTSTTDSQPHEDRVYRQPMKWFNDVDKNSKYKIGYNSIELALEGLNATDHVAGVDVQDADENSLLNWVRTLTKVRNDHPELINGRLSMQAPNNGLIIYTLTANGRSTRVYINQSPDATTIQGTVYSVNVGGKTLRSAYNLNGTSLASGGVAIVAA